MSLCALQGGWFTQPSAKLTKVILATEEVMQVHASAFQSLRASEVREALLSDTRVLPDGLVNPYLVDSIVGSLQAEGYPVTHESVHKALLSFRKRLSSKGG